jgi:hypothetical protein
LKQDIKVAARPSLLLEDHGSNLSADNFSDQKIAVGFYSDLVGCLPTVHLHIKVLVLELDGGASPTIPSFQDDSIIVGKVLLSDLI